MDKEYLYLVRNASAQPRGASHQVGKLNVTGISLGAECLPVLPVVALQGAVQSTTILMTSSTIV